MKLNGKIARVLMLGSVLSIGCALPLAAQGAADPTAELAISLNLSYGESVLYIQGNALIWHRLYGDFPSSVRVNGLAWEPDWSDCAGKTSNESCYSGYFHGSIANYNPDNSDGTELIMVSPAGSTPCPKGIGGFFSALSCRLPGWTDQQFVRSAFYQRPAPDAASAFHLLFGSTGATSFIVRYNYIPESAFFDVVPNNTGNYISCSPIKTKTACKVLAGVWNAFALFAPANDYPDGKVLWPAMDPSPTSAGTRHMTLTMSGEGIGTVMGMMSASYIIDFDRDGNWDWVVPFRFPDTFTCSPGEAIGLTLDLRFPTGRHLQGTDVVRCPVQ